MPRYLVSVDVMGPDPFELRAEIESHMPETIEADSEEAAYAEAVAIRRAVTAGWDPRTTGLDGIAVGVYLPEEEEHDHV